MDEDFETGESRRVNSNKNNQDGVVKSTAKGAAKGAVKKGAKTAVKDGVKDGVDGAKKGAQLGAKLGGSIPYAGAVLGPVFGVVGGVAGGAGGTTKGLVKGAVKGGTQGAIEGGKEGAENAIQNRKRNSIRNGVGSLWDNIKGAFRGNKKDIFMLKVKAIKTALIAGISILVFFALAVMGNAEDTSYKSDKSVNAVFENSTSEAAELYKNTGSLLLATNDEIDDVVDKFFDEIDNTNEAYYDALSKKYKNKDSQTVANRVAHITTNFEADETAELEKVNITNNRLSNEVDPGDNVSIYKHILLAEKYNFNNIVWRSSQKNSSGSFSPISNMTVNNSNFTVDSDTGLKYPKIDNSAIDGDTFNLEFFVNKTRQYLQTWHIPFDIMIGTQDAQSNGVLNTDLAYEIITSAYHEIVMDRYKLEEKTRNTNYLVYDQTTTTTTTTRTCADYTVPTGTNTTTTKVSCTDGNYSSCGTLCTPTEYAQNKCGDRPINFYYGVQNRLVYCYDKPTNTVAPLDSNWESKKATQTNIICTYGKRTVTNTNTTYGTAKYCTDTVTTNVDVERDIRESKVAITRPVLNTLTTANTDTTQYRWNYVISAAKLFDKVFSNEYEPVPYHNHSLASYRDFINKTGQYASMSASDFADSEEANAQADSFMHSDEPYHDDQTSENNANWNNDKLVTSIPANATKKTGTQSSRVVKTVVNVVKDGKEYTDEYKWSDTLDHKGSKSGIYNMESVEDVVCGELEDDEECTDLNSNERSYYSKLYSSQELNLIDLMNADKDIIKNYVAPSDMSSSTDNIGIRRGALDIAYNVLRSDLKEKMEKYNTGLTYGNSLGISPSGMLSGLGLANIAAAGSVNEAMVAAADAHMGYTLAQLRAIDTHGIFGDTHWCAMFVSYCMRTIEDQLGIDIPVPTYWSCTTFRKSYIDKPGVYDVEEWVNTQGGPSDTVTSDPNHIAPLSAIQPGDIILYDWGLDGDRDHTAIVKTVEKDASGNVTSITTIDGNWGGRGSASWRNSTVKTQEHSLNGGSYSGLAQVASFVSISTVMAEAEKGNTW